MTREEAAEILKRSVEELNDLLDGVTMNECTEATILRNIDAYSMAVDALLEKVGVSDRNVGKSEPLTLEEIMKMDGEPVWVVWPDLRIHSQWFIVGSVFWIEMFVEDDGTLLSGYGNRWIAYRQKP